MAVLFVILAIGVIALVAMAASGRLGELPGAQQDLRPQIDPDKAEFDVVLRGYRMDEVDAAIDRLQSRIDELSARQESGGSQGT